VVIGTTEGETILAMNNGKKPFDDLKVRQAMSYAVDRKAIIDGAMFGYGTPIGSHYSPVDPGYVDLTGMYPYNPGKAKELLKEAGYADGFKVTLKLPPPSYARRGGEIIAQQLKAVGVEAEIIPVEWAQWISDVFKNKNYDLTIVSHTEPADYNVYARDDYYFDYHSDALKSLVNTLDLTMDAGERNRLIGDIQKKIAEDAVNVFLFELAKTGVWNAKIEGLWANSPIQANDLTAVYWKE
jgi:peptide/nickel transport system substrate-binding protein